MMRSIFSAALVTALTLGAGSAAATDYVLALSWEPAFCKFNGSGKKECALISGQSYEGRNFVLHGLWPQPESNSYCGVPDEVKANDKPGQWHKLPAVAYADPNTHGRLVTYMPGIWSMLDRHEWIKHGTCAKATPDDYFNRAVDLVYAMSQGQTAKLVSTSVGKDVTTASLCEALSADLGAGVHKTAQIKTRNAEVNGKKTTVMTELWIYLSDAVDGKVALDAKHLAEGYGSLNCSDRKVRILAP